MPPIRLLRLLVIVFDSSKDKRWTGRGFSLSGSNIIVYKNAEISHPISLTSGNYKLKVAGHNRTGACSFWIKIASTDNEIYLNEQISFAKNFTEKIIDFNIPYLIGNVNFLIYRKKDDYGSLDIGRITLDKEVVVLAPAKVVTKKKVETPKIEIKENKKIKLGFIVPYTIYGGAEVYLNTLINNLNLDFFEVHLIYLKNNPLEMLIDKKEIISKKISTNENLINYLNISNFNYVIYYNSLQVYNLCQEFANNNSYTKLIEIYHSDFLWSDAVAKLKERRNLKILFSVSTNLMDSIVGPERKISLPVPIELEKFNQAKHQPKPILNLPTDKKIIGTVARLSKEKNINYILDLAKNIPEYNFVIIGDGKEENSLKLRIAQEEIKNVFFLGFKKDAFRYYQMFDAFVLTSLMEGTPISILEAMSSEVPVFSTNVGEIKSIIKDGETGFFLSGKIKDDVQKVRNNIDNKDVVSNAKKYVSNVHNSVKIAETFTNELLNIKKLYSNKVNARLLPGEYV